MPQVNHNEIPRNTKNQPPNNNYPHQNNNHGWDPIPDWTRNINLGKILFWIVLAFLAIPAVTLVHKMSSYLVSNHRWFTDIIAALVFLMIVSRLNNSRR